MAIQDEQKIASSAIEEALQGPEAQTHFHRTILHYAQESIIVTNLQGTIIYWNPGASAVFGYTAEEMLGKTPALLYPEAGKQLLMYDLHAILAGQDYQAEWKGRHKDGTTVWVDIKTTVLRNQTGEALGFIGVATDITEHKRIEEALLTSEERLRLALEAGKIGVWDWDVQHDVLTWSDRVYELHDVSKETFEVTVENFLRLIHPEDLGWVQEAIEKSLRAYAPFNIQFRIVTLHKEIRWLTTSARVIYDQADKPLRMLGATSDITRQKELEERKDEFISMASHELKTPVTSIKGFTHLLHRRLKQRNDEEAMHFLTRIDGQLNRLTQLISDLMDISKMQVGKLEYRQEPFDLDVLVQETVENMQGTTHTHLLVFEHTVPARVFGDKVRIGQVLTNLLTNAIKYSPRANNVVVRLATEQNNALVSVQDFGIGIADAYQEKIFERFYQVSEPDTTTRPGLGMGLYIASEIIKWHGGCIRVTSQKGAGATFSFTLPLLIEG